MIKKLGVLVIIGPHFYFPNFIFHKIINSISSVTVLYCILSLSYIVKESAYVYPFTSNVLLIVVCPLIIVVFFSVV
jgi:hypothetical protein